MKQNKEPLTKLILQEKCESLYVKAADITDGSQMSIQLFPLDPFPQCSPCGPGGFGFLDFVTSLAISPIFILYGAVTYPFVSELDEKDLEEKD